MRSVLCCAEAGRDGRQGRDAQVEQRNGTIDDLAAGLRVMGKVCRTWEENNLFCVVCGKYAWFLYINAAQIGVSQRLSISPQTWSLNGVWKAKFNLTTHVKLNSTF